MSTDHAAQPGGGVSPARRPDLRRRIAVGATGAAVVLGVGAYAITSQLVGRDSTGNQDVGALAPLVSAEPTLSPSAAASASPSVSPSMSLDASVASSPAAEPTPTASPASIAPEVRKKIDEARAAAAKDGYSVKRAPQPAKSTVPADKIKVRTVTTENGTIRISTARADLTGSDDHLIAADNGKAVGHSRCTHQFRFAGGAPVKEIPTLLLCWRMSADRSVLTMANSPGKAPSEAESAKLIDEEWRKLD